MDSHALKGVNSMYSEEAIRSYFKDYTERILKMAMGEAQFGDEEEEEMMAMNHQRLRELKNTLTFKCHAKVYIKY